MLHLMSAYMYIYIYNIYSLVQVKFHVISHYKLRSCSSSQDASSLHYLNMEQLTKTLTSLFTLYEANRSPNSAYENEAEFRSFYVLLHLGSNRQPMVDLNSLFLFNPFLLLVGALC